MWIVLLQGFEPGLVEAKDLKYTSEDFVHLCVIGKQIFTYNIHILYGHKYTNIVMYVNICKLELLKLPLWFLACLQKRRCWLGKSFSSTFVLIYLIIGQVCCHYLYWLDQLVVRYAKTMFSCIERSVVHFFIWKLLFSACGQVCFNILCTHPAVCFLCAPLMITFSVHILCSL